MKCQHTQILLELLVCVSLILGLTALFEAPATELPAVLPVHQPGECAGSIHKRYYSSLKVACTDGSIELAWSAGQSNGGKAYHLSFNRMEGCKLPKSGEECGVHELSEVRLDLGVLVLHVVYSEGEDYKVVDLRSATIAVLDAEPWLSPTGEYLLEMAASSGFDNGPYLMIWQRRAGGYVREWKSTLGVTNEADYSIKSWPRDGCLLVSVTSDNGDYQFRKWTAQVWKTASTWKFRPFDKSSSCVNALPSATPRR